MLKNVKVFEFQAFCFSLSYVANQKLTKTDLNDGNIFINLTPENLIRSANCFQKICLFPRSNQSPSMNSKPVALNTCVDDALNGIPTMAQIPKAAAFAMLTNTTPAIPTVVCDSIGSLHFIKDKTTNTNCKEENHDLELALHRCKYFQLKAHL